MPIGRKRTVIEFPVQRVECKACGSIRQVKAGFADEMSRYTRSFERYVLDLSSHTNIADTANHLEVSWDVVKDIQKRYLKRKFSRPRLAHLKRIAIDEIYVGKSRKYLTIVLDLDTGAVVFVGEGKGADSLESFWKRLKRSRAKVDAVAIDMSQAYIHAVTTNLPKATLAKGYPIGSGVIWACRNLINDRLELTGMSWTIQGAESVMRLRAVHINKDWDDFWKRRRTSELRRLYGPQGYGLTRDPGSRALACRMTPDRK